MLLLQETDDEEGETSYMKQCLQAFLRWLCGLSWVQHLKNKRQRSFEVFWKMSSVDFCSFVLSAPPAVVEWL